MLLIITFVLLLAIQITALIFILKAKNEFIAECDRRNAFKKRLAEVLDTSTEK